MLKFYYSKGSSALAAHILLEEVGATYDAIEVSIEKGEHQSTGFLARAPKGRIPLLETPQGTLSENPAILEYIAARHPRSGMVPQDAFEQAQARSLASYLCATVHVAVAHHKRAARWADLQGSHQDMRQKAPENLRECVQFLDRSVALSPWAMGRAYSFCDPYLFLLSGWLKAVGESLDAAPNLLAHQEAMRARPATQKICTLYGII